MHRRGWGVVVAAALAVPTLGIAPPRAVADDPPAPVGRHFTMAFTGDILAHVPVNDQAWRYGGKVTYDYRPMFADIQPLIAGADLAICHLEGPIAPPNVKFTGQPVFGSPPDIAVSIVAVGYDRCSTASNHSMDKGVPGINATLNAFDAAGLGHSGTARTPEEAISPILDVNGVKVVHLSYAYGFNGHRLPPNGELWRANLIDPAKILADAANARARGAEVVVVSLHWGIEYRAKVTTEQRQLAQTLTASGLVDLIVGHHAHVIEPIEKINGKWVVFGMGNIVSNQRPATGCPEASQDGVVISVEVTENPGGGFTVGTPSARATWVYPGPYVALDVKNHLNDPALPKWVRSQLAKSLKRTTKTLGSFVSS